MIEPLRALVRPRAISPATGQSLLLEDLVADLIESGNRRPIQIIGGPGSGKTTALRHLAAVLTERILTQGIAYLDEPRANEEIILRAEQGDVVVSTQSVRSESDNWATLRLDCWGEDDFIEYLRARHPTACPAVVAGVRLAGDAWKLEGIAELCTFTLDYLAAHPASMPALAALRAGLLDKNRALPQFQTALQCALAYVLKADILGRSLEKSFSGPELPRLLRHGPVRRVLAVEAMASDLATGDNCAWLKTQLPRNVVQLLAEHIRPMNQAMSRVHSFLSDDNPDPQPMAASICHQLDRRWLPALLQAGLPALPRMTRAYLDHADWPDVKLAGAQFGEADLSFANLEGASLDGATAKGTSFDGAQLARANLHALAAAAANFSQADLRNADLHLAQLPKAVFRQAKLDGASFHSANLRLADFTGASCRGQIHGRCSGPSHHDRSRLHARRP